LYERFRTAADVASRKRLQVLWLVRSGERVRDAAQQAGVGERTAVRWLGWYRAGGASAVLGRVPGHGAAGAPARLSEDQKWLLAQESASGAFRTYDEARDWVRERYGVAYSYKGMYSLLSRLGVHPKVPRPIAERTDLEAQEAWKRGGSRRR
jgi:transposase